MRDFEDERKEADATAAWEKERAERAEEVGSKSAKRAAKRQRQKEAKQAKPTDEPAEKPAPTAQGKVSSAGAADDAGGGPEH